MRPRKKFCLFSSLITLAAPSLRGGVSSSLLVTLLLLLTAPRAGSEPDADALVEWARSKVVLVYVETVGPPRWGTGFVAETGRIITNQHVVQDARAITIWANGAPYVGRVAAVDAPHDLAALAIPGDHLQMKPLDLASGSQNLPGEEVVILASRAQIHQGRGYVRVWPVPGSVWGYAWLRWPNGLSDTDLRLRAIAIPGDSGSPVLRLRDGAVIGILRGRTNPDATGRSETAWAVPVEAAHTLLARTHLAPPPDNGAEHYYLEPLAGH